jgi:hypothetical protein
VSARQSLAGTLERPGRDMFCTELRLRPGEQQRGDPQRRRVYAWEFEVLGGREHMFGRARNDGLIGPYSIADTRSVRAAARKAADAYLAHLWQRERRRATPFQARAVSRRPHAHANSLRHEIYCTSAVRRTTLVHEVAHLLTWRDGGHGPQFCGVLLTLWQREFGIDRARALSVAARMDVAIESVP